MSLERPRLSASAFGAHVRATAGGRTLTLVGIAGHAGAGKSTLAAALPAATVVSTEDFWDGAGFAIERIADEVVTPLLEGRGAEFVIADRHGDRPGPFVRVEPTGVIVIEGVCALHRLLRSAYTIRAWIDTPLDERLARLTARGGVAAREEWLDTWREREERYVARDRPVACADMIVDGRTTQPVPVRVGR